MDFSLLSPEVLFSGTADGKIVKLIGRRIHTVATLGKPPCGEKKHCSLVSSSSDILILIASMFQQVEVILR